MSPKDGLKDIRRILVALDASPASMAALDLAAALAADICWMHLGWRAR